MTLNARWAFFDEKNNHIGWSGASGRLTLDARWAFFNEKTSNIRRSGAGGRMTLNARWACLAKRQIMLDEAEHVDG